MQEFVFVEPHCVMVLMPSKTHKVVKSLKGNKDQNNLHSMSLDHYSQSFRLCNIMYMSYLLKNLSDPATTGSGSGSLHQLSSIGSSLPSFGSRIKR